MALICQRSPCDRFLEGLGRWIFGKPDNKPDHYIQRVYVEDSDETTYMVIENRLEYCPFCGTRLDDIHEGYLTTKKAKARPQPRAPRAPH